MTVDLSQYLGQKVEITYEDGSHEVGRITRNEYHSNEVSLLHYAFHPDKGHRQSFTEDGFYWSAKTPSSRNIIHIKPIIMKKYEQLENQIKKLQAEYEQLENQIKKLQAEVERLKKEEEASTKLPLSFSREKSIAFLTNPTAILLDEAFVWGSTPQGSSYWLDIESSLHKKSSYKVPQEAIMAIQSWVIESYKEQYGV